VSSNSDRDRDEMPAAAHLREAVRGHKPEQVEADAHVGLADDETVRRLLSHLAAHYDPRAADREMPADVTETRLWQMLVSKESTETLTRAIRDGRLDQLSYAVGDPGARADVSGLKAIESIEQILDREAPILYIYGEPGSGKTNISLLLAQVWVRLQERRGLDYELASNIRTLSAQDAWIETYSALEAWAKEHVEALPEGGETLADDAPRKLYIFDEASSHALGSGEQGYQTGQLLGPLVKTIRKGNCGLIIIGHDGKDVHPAVRELCKVCQRYVENQKRATFYHTIRNRSPEDKIVDVHGVPQTDYQYDDKEDTRFRWDAGDGDDAALDAARDLAADMVQQEKRRIAAEMYLSDTLDAKQGDIGKAFGHDQSWVSRAVDAYQRGDLPQDGDGMGVNE
jgi:hypothetical protein